MVPIRTLYKIPALICLFWHSLANAQSPALPAPVSFIGQYSFSWGGITLGKLGLYIDEKPGEYKVSLTVTSAGVVNLFTRHENVTFVTGKREPGHYAPEHYESFYKTKKKPRHIRLKFDAKGKVVEELNEPPENRDLRPEVPATLKDGSYDPLTSLMVLRSGQTTITAFDAKRLYEMKAEDKGKESLYVIDADIPVQHYILTRKPLAGMTAKETKEYNEGEPPLHIYFSNDARHVPVYITMPIFMGSVKGTLTKECATWDECKVK